MPKQQRVMEGSSGGKSYEDMLRSAEPAKSAFESVGRLTPRSAQRELERLEKNDPGAIRRRKEFYEQQQKTQDKLAEAKIESLEDYNTVKPLKKPPAVKYAEGGKVTTKPKAKTTAKKGGRGDGIAQRGKTKGRII
jgi:hypothetical protein